MERNGPKIMVIKTNGLNPLKEVWARSGKI
jgi:hypothetical protein